MWMLTLRDYNKIRHPVIAKSEKAKQWMAKIICKTCKIWYFEFKQESILDLAPGAGMVCAVSVHILSVPLLWSRHARQLLNA